MRCVYERIFKHDRWAYCDMYYRGYSYSVHVLYLCVLEGFDVSKSICNLCGEEYPLFEHELGKHKIKYEESSSIHFRHVDGHRFLGKWLGTDVYMYEICPDCAARILRFVESLKVKE